jgi:hypothetical protein
MTDLKKDFLKKKLKYESSKKDMMMDKITGEGTAEDLKSDAKGAGMMCGYKKLKGKK